MVTNWVDRRSSILQPAAGSRIQAGRGSNGISLSAELTSAFVAAAPRTLEKHAGGSLFHRVKGSPLLSRRFAGIQTAPQKFHCRNIRLPLKRRYTINSSLRRSYICLTLFKISMNLGFQTNFVLRLLRKSEKKYKIE